MYGPNNPGPLVSEGGYHPLSLSLKKKKKKSRN